MMEFIRKSASGWAVKVLFALICIVFVFWGVGSYKSQEGSIIGYVDEEPITVKEYKAALERTFDDMKRRFPGLTQEALIQLGFKSRVYGELVDNVLVRRKAAELGLVAANHEVRRAVSMQPAFQNELGMFDFDRYRRVLRSSGMNETAFEARVRDDILSQKVRTYVTMPVELSESDAREEYLLTHRRATVDYVLFRTDDYLDEAKPTPENVRTYYEENPQQFTEPAKIKLEYLALTPAELAKQQDVADLDIITYYEGHRDEFQLPEQVKARHILIRSAPSGTDEERQAAKAKIEDIRAQIANGLDFAEAAKKFSQDGTASKGGELGWFGRGSMVKPFETTAFALAPGELSQPVQTRFGWHLLLVDEKREAGVQPLAEVRERIKQNLARERAMNDLADVVDEATEQALSGVPLAVVASSLKLEVRTTELFSQGAQPKGLRLQPQAAEVLFSLQESEVSEPLPYNDGYLIAHVAERQEQRLQTLDEVRDQAEQAVQRKTATTLAQAAAQDAATRLQSPEGEEIFLAEHGDRVQTTEPFDRQGLVAGLGQLPGMAQQVLDGEKGWLPQPYPAMAGFIVVKNHETLPPEEGAWAREGEQYLATLTNQRRDQLWNAFLTGLRDGVSLEMVNPQYLD